MPEVYDAFYYATSCGRPYRRDEEWLAFFGRMADRIIQDLNPRTVMDAGCAHGFLVEALRDRGVEAYGVDASAYAIGQVRPDVSQYCTIGSLLGPFPQTYDLIVCIEVVEHLAAAQAHDAIGNLCRHADDILFSSTPDDYTEPTHLNVRPVEHWAEHFARNGFFRDLDFDTEFIAPQAMRFRRSSDPAHRMVANYERKLWSQTRETAALRRQVIEMKNQLSAAWHPQPDMPLGWMRRVRTRHKGGTT
ncbi:MAG: methyltransferase domain-containing protein [Actinomycetota bacterium]